jgi:hypothetical protein
MINTRTYQYHDVPLTNLLQISTSENHHSCYVMALKKYTLLRRPTLKASCQHGFLGSFK